MAALPYPKYGIDKLYLFPYYQTREAYEQATGRSCPPWDKTRRPKCWCDPQADDDSNDFVVYERVLATDMKVSGRPLADPNGKPFLRRLVLPKEIAATVNIPPAQSTMEGADVPEYPAPLRPLESNEELFFDPNAPGSVAVKNTDLYPAADTGFTAPDRALLHAIARKLGV